MADARDAIAGDTQNGQASHIINRELDRGKSRAAAGMTSVTSAL